MKYYLKITKSLFHVTRKQICPQALHFYQKLQAKRMNFRPTNFQKPLFLACNHVTRQSYWWCVGGHYNRMFFFWRIYMKIGFSSRRREMLLFLTLTHHQYGCCDVKCKPAIVIHFNLLQVSLSEPPFVFALLFIPSSTVVSSYFYVSVNMVAVSSV